MAGAAERRAGMEPIVQNAPIVRPSGKMPIRKTGASKNWAQVPAVWKAAKKPEFRS
jgi:hypothetical protein